MAHLPVSRPASASPPASPEERRIPVFDRLFPRVRLELPPLSDGWRRYGRVALLALALTVGLVLCLVLTAPWQGAGGTGKHPQQGGFPSVNGSPSREELTRDGGTEPPADTEGGGSDPAEGSGEETSASRDENQTASEEASHPLHTDVGSTAPDGTVPPPPETPSEETTHPDDPSDTLQPDETDGEAPPSAPATDGGDSDGDSENGEPTVTTTPPSASDPDGSDTDEGTRPAETEAPAPQQPPSIPAGCIPIRPLDLSMAERGAGYVLHTGGRLPAALPPTLFADRGEPPTVLLVNTHPYEGYSQGEAWFDPAAGSLAVTPTPNHPTGVVALGSLLTRHLRGLGITVIHLRVAVSAEDTAEEIYDRVAGAVEDYLRLYPDIGLVLDLRRCAEMTEDGGILRTAGSYRGTPCAQIRLTVHGGRGEGAVAGDLAAALYLRRILWSTEPTLSRPVRVKGGAGLSEGHGGVRFLTLDMGAAGNTREEAAALVPLLGDALGRMLSDSQNYG